MRDPDDIRRHYERLHTLHGNSPAAVQYSDRDSQEARFRVLAEIGSLDGARVLDFGCGLGHMLDWLKAEDIRVNYTGVDIVPGFLGTAAERHPEHRFCSWEDLDDTPFDWAFVSGVFNNRRADNWGFMTDTVSALFARTLKGVAFNAMSTWVDWQDADLWYVEPERVFTFAKSQTPFITLRNDYLVREVSVPFEFACYLYHQPQRVLP